MESRAYYNEIDPYCAQWLRNLIAEGLIAHGDVDERSIEDVTPNDIKHYTQCHFFAGIAGWSLALRLAGIPDHYPIWTASCPCQPFSAAGARAGFADVRHLWPSLYWLVIQLRPAKLIGEQVASSAAGPWIDLVQADMEALDYAFGAVPFPAASVGAPHIRDRLYWVGESASVRCARKREKPEHGKPVQAGEGPGRLGYAGGQRLGERISLGGVSGRTPGAAPREATQRAGIYLGWMANPDSSEREARHLLASSASESGEGRVDALLHGGDLGRSGPVNGPWADADWIFCRDGKWRPVEPGTFPLADGIPGRVGQLRAYGNAIVPQQAAAFIRAALC